METQDFPLEYLLRECDVFALHPLAFRIIRQIVGEGLSVVQIAQNLLTTL